LSGTSAGKEIETGPLGTLIEYPCFRWTLDPDFDVTILIHLVSQVIASTNYRHTETGECSSILNCFI